VYADGFEIFLLQLHFNNEILNFSPHLAKCFII
jgi:hypothetical protein